MTIKEKTISDVLFDVLGAQAKASAALYSKTPEAIPVTNTMLDRATLEAELQHVKTMVHSIGDCYATRIKRTEHDGQKLSIEIASVIEGLEGALIILERDQRAEDEAGQPVDFSVDRDICSPRGR